MATQYRIELKFPEEIGTVTGEYTGRETAIERCRYWLENGACEVSAKSLMTGALAFHRKAPRYAAQQ